MKRSNLIRRWSRRTSVAVAIVTAGGCVGIASVGAYFSASGTGDGQGAVGSSSVAVSATTGTAATALVPGGSAAVALQVHNPNGHALTLTSVTGSGAITADAGHPGCAPTGVTFTDQTALSIVLPANSTTPVSLTGAASMSTLSASGCQGATFTIPVTIGVRTS